MTTELTIADDRDRDGPAMSCLTTQEHAFVTALTSTVGGDGKPDPRRAAAAAGYRNPIYGYELMRKDKILDAIREESDKRLRGGVLMAIDQLMTIGGNPKHKNQLQAIKMIMEMGGQFASIQKVDVNHRGAVEHVHVDARERVERLAERMGKTPQQVLEMLGVKIMDAEFEDVIPAESAEIWEVDA